MVEVVENGAINYEIRKYDAKSINQLTVFCPQNNIPNY